MGRKSSLSLVRSCGVQLMEVVVVDDDDAWVEVVEDDDVCA